MVLLAGDGTRAGRMGLLQEHLITSDKLEQLAERRERHAGEDAAAAMEAGEGRMPHGVAWGSVRQGPTPRGIARPARPPHATEVGGSHGEAAYLVHQIHGSAPDAGRVLPCSTRRNIDAIK